ncbi:spindle assembly abnormal 4 [Andrena cerasifolii]|uniref:spindle assembly abnormal 4 n=1 Tax=Andrena cerasifolii TaxID=2819439 RepID=UPI0040377188
MDLEASIVERLQKLRQWQLQQQERLLKHQQIQREMLTQEQDCICKALELSLQELDMDGSISRKNNSNESEGSTEINNKELSVYNNSWEKKSSIELMNDSESSVSQYTNDFECIIPQRSPAEKVVNIDSRTKERCKGKAMSDIKVRLTLPSPRREKDLEHFIVDGVAPLLPIETIINHSIDDIPIPSPKKDFHTLLEERLKDSETKPSERADDAPVNKVKQPFLRKGEGLNRFKLNRKLHVPAMKKRSRSASFSVNAHLDSKHSKGEPKYSHTTRSLKNTRPTKNPHHTAVSQKRLSLKDVPLPKSKVRSKSESSTSVTRLENGLSKVINVGDLNTSDFKSGTQKEMEEVRIFELLEEKAENSSFCSTSSTVLAFLQQSTPFKAKQKGHSTKDSIVNAKQPSPIIKRPEAQATLKSNQAYICTSNKNNDSYYNFASFVGQTALEQDAKENNKMDTDIKRQTLLRNQVQSVHSQGDSYDCSNVENNNEADVSLHVRFSEYNEYKTIGLTDTSSISTDSFLINNLSDEKVWNDTLTPEISDTETVSLPFEELRSPVIVDGSIQNNNCASKFEQCNMNKELSYEGNSLGNTRQENDFNCNEDTNQVAYNDESEYSDVSDQPPDDEQSALRENNKKNLTSQAFNAFYDTKESPKSLEKCDIRKADECLGNSNNVIVIEDQKDQEDAIFKSELLKSRLVELEQEINIFRKESTTLSIQRKKLQEDHRTLHKEFSEKEKILEENRKQAEDRLQEERKKLAREKTALESRMRDAQEKAQQSKLERQELQSLKQEIDKLRDEMHVKESRWNAAQSRHKCQMRVLKMENLKLKQEIERLQSLKKTNVRSKGKPGTYSNTKAIHQINKQLSAQGKETKKNHDNSSSDDNDRKLVEPTMKAADTADAQNIEEDRYNCVANNSVINEKLQKSQTSMVNIARKCNLYENLIKEATSEMFEVQEHLPTSENFGEANSELRDKLKNLNRRMNTLEDEAERTNRDSDVASSNRPNDNIPLRMENDYAQFISPTKMSLEDHNNKLPSISPDESSLNAHTKATSSSYQNSSKIDKQDIRQIQHPDGRIEYWYSNGNVKKIFPDQGLTKLIYYNGDVRETNTDGRVKYFYASTHTWHTTMPDGLEVLEFADGQVERRSQTGAVEVSFPDGSVRILDSDGSEKWTLPDGTLIQTFINGEKILTLPNGQQEIHTKDHKRREYPDGTVKLIYPDGTQETRYSNGRIRLKDRDGNLLMDSYQ